MLKGDIGINAGAIWQLLSEKKSKLSIREIEELTSYKESMILLALGWLGREDKIRFLDEDGQFYVELNSFASETYY